MYKTCSLSTVKNTPSEARRDTASVVYYYIDFERDNIIPDVPTWLSLRGAIETIWDTLSISDLEYLNGHYICAYMSDDTRRRVRLLKVDREQREMRICRVE